jgi:hypothetical protein
MAEEIVWVAVARMTEDRDVYQMGVGSTEAAATNALDKHLEYMHAHHYSSSGYGSLEEFRNLWVFDPVEEHKVWTEEEASKKST